jgi:hypothetical protein
LFSVWASMASELHVLVRGHVPHDGQYRGVNV